MRRLCLTLVLSCLACATRAETDSFPPLRLFLDPPDIGIPRLSPSGRALAVTVTRDSIDTLAVVDTESMQFRPLLQFGDFMLRDYWWKGEDMLVLLMEDPAGHTGYRRLDLGATATVEIRHLRKAVIVDALLADPDHVLAATSNVGGCDLRRVNVRAESSEVLHKAIPNVETWLTDSAGTPVVAFGRNHADWFLLTRPNASAPWTRRELGHQSQPDLWPRAVHQGKLLAIDYASADTARAVLWDPANQNSDALFAAEPYDCADTVTWGSSDPIARAVLHYAEHPHLTYLAPADQALATEIDSALPDTFNQIISVSADLSRMIIQAESDTVPSRLWLLNRTKMGLVPLGETRPGLSSKALIAGESFHFTSRDGLNLTGRWFARPPAGNPQPLIVVLRRDLDEPARPGFEPVVQLLASRGYAVAQINHRGKQGFGRRLALAGNGQMGLAMADDIADGVRWLIAERQVDPTRVALFGEGLGGIVAVHTLARHPDLFAAWLNLGTPMSLRAIADVRLQFGPYDARRPSQALGGAWRQEQYQKSLDPFKLLPKITVPSYHWYDRSMTENTVHGDGERVRKHYAGSKVAFQFVTAAPYTGNSIKMREWRELARERQEQAFAELLAFLGKTMPAGR